jgi:hypothetical protein
VLTATDWTKGGTAPFEIFLHNNAFPHHTIAQRKIYAKSNSFVMVHIFLKNKTSKKLILMLKNTATHKTLTYVSETWTLANRDCN